MINGLVAFGIIAISLVLLAYLYVAFTWVLWDADDRGLNAPMWAFAALLFQPGLGLAVYLVARRKHPPVESPESTAGGRSVPAQEGPS